MAFGMTFWSIVVAVLAALLVGPLYAPTHVFSEKVMLQVAKNAIKKGHGNSTAIVNEVKYPRWVAKEPKWMFNNAGGAMGSMAVLHASFSEYVIIFGTAVGTEGATGRFMADDWFTILAGQQWAHSAGKMSKEIYKAGDQHHLKYGEFKQYKMPDECWALEYARGNIVSMLPFGMFDTIFSTLDFYTFYQTVIVSAHEMLNNLLQGKI
ncbi:ERG2/sigma1 receptor-like protein [Baffinella frigidus]|nr:ERG2/sigma1 receptor-like protein [Cryptophyta sp. CCMP2293]